MDIPSNLPREHVKTLQEFKQRVIDEHGQEAIKDEYRLLRFLRAREYDVNKATLMLNNHLEWRKKYQIDTILQDYTIPEVYQKYLPLSKLFYDKEGSPTRYFWYGNMDAKGFINSAKKIHYFKTFFYAMEEDIKVMEAKTKGTGKLYETWNYIIDFQNFTLADATYKEAIEIYLAFFSAYEANYPERLKRGIVINASVYFTILYSLIKPLLSENTVRKLQIFGKSGWKEELLQCFDSKTLPAILGGELTDPDGDPRCLSLINEGGTIPKECYVSYSERRLAGERGVESFTIKRLSSKTIDVDVTDPGSQIEWEFETANRNIGFGLRYRKTAMDTNTSVELAPVQKVDTSMFSETGLYLCHKSGIYTLVFDNRFSWIRSKELYYRLHLVLPSGAKKCITT